MVEPVNGDIASGLPGFLQLQKSAHRSRHWRDSGSLLGFEAVSQEGIA
jgi:hypothetical protein